MVKLTRKFIKNIKSKSITSAKTHLYANNKCIDEIAGDVFESLSTITVIYLHNNFLTSVAKLSFLTNLTHINLQWNKITSLEDFHHLQSLTNLYVGHNCIQILDGLHHVPKLKVLHVQNQKWSTRAIHFSFSSQTITELSHSLMELDVSGNNIITLSDLQSLYKIARLNVSHNSLYNINEVCDTVQKLKTLRVLQIDHNPIAENKKYEYDIVASSGAIEEINRRTVSTMSRIFLQTLKKMKTQHQQRLKQSKKMEFSSKTKSFVHQLPPEFRGIVSGSTFHSQHYTNETKNLTNEKFNPSNLIFVERNTK